MQPFDKCSVKYKNNRILAMDRMKTLMLLPQNLIKKGKIRFVLHTFCTSANILLFLYYSYLIHFTVYCICL